MERHYYWNRALVRIENCLWKFIGVWASFVVIPEAVSLKGRVFHLKSFSNMNIKLFHVKIQFDLNFSNPLKLATLNHRRFHLKSRRSYKFNG